MPRFAVKDLPLGRTLIIIIIIIITIIIIIIIIMDHLCYVVVSMPVYYPISPRFDSRLYPRNVSGNIRVWKGVHPVSLGQLGSYLICQVAKSS